MPWIDLVTEQVACFPTIWWPKTADGTLGAPESKAAWVCRRIGLALAPFGADKQVRAFLVRRPVIALTSVPKPRKPGEPFSLADLWIEDVLVLGMPDEEGGVYSRYGTLKLPNPEAARSVASCEASDFPGDDHEFKEVSPASLAAILESRFPEATNVQDDTLRLPRAAFTKSPPGSRAVRLEQVLLYGRHFSDKDSVLMRRLEERAELYVAGLRAWVDAQTARIEDAMVTMAGRSR